MGHRAATGQLTVLKDSRDLSRAIACSAAISERDDFAKCLGILMTLNPEDKFEEIYLSPPSEEQQFVMAHAEDAVFIGFQGSKLLKDIACDMMVNKVDKKHLGSYHSGIYQRSGAFLGLLGSRMFFSLEKLIQLRKRIIFCGHSLGGAVAHMVLMRLLLENEHFDVKNEKYLDPNAMISIAFGAPHLCDKIAAGLINDTPNYKSRFISIVNRQDPVPRLLHDLNNSVAKMISEAEDLIVASTRLERLGKFVGTYLTFVTTGEFKIEEPKDSSVQPSSQSWRELIGDLRHRAPKGQNEYKPIGIYVIVDGDQPEPVKEIESTSESINEYLRDVQLQRLIEHHVCASYLKALIDTSLIRGHVPVVSAAAIKDALSTLPKPEVSEAVGAGLDGGNTYTCKIYGKNLMLLRGVRLDGKDIEAQKILLSTDTKLVFVSDNTSPKNKCLGTLEVSTAFGTSNLSEVFLRDRRSLLPKLVQSLMQMAAENELPTEDQEQRLDGILRCHASNATDGPSMKSVLDSCRRKTAAEKAIREMGEVDQVNKMAEAAVKFMQSDLSLEFKTSDPSRFFDLKRVASAVAFGSPMTGSAVGYISAVSSSATVSSLAPVAGVSTGLVFGALVFTLGVTGWMVCKGIKLGGDLFLKGYTWYMKLDVLDYDAVLRTAVTEVLLWNVPPKSSTTFTEDDLVIAVDGSNRKFKEMLKAAVGKAGSTDLKLKFGILQYATPDSIEKLLKWIYAIVETKKLYKELNIEGRYFVAILGEEDAGKSSFIQEVLVGDGISRGDESLPAEGVDIHTQGVTSYKLKSGMILVDFPGINGSEAYANWWKQYTALPDLVVLLLNFENDIKQDQIERYELIIRHFKCHHDSSVIVAFNKVDQKLSGDVNDPFLKTDATGKGTYFPQLASKTALKLDCSAEDVHYVALKPYGENTRASVKKVKKEDMKELKKVGVFDLDGFMEKINNRMPAQSAQTMRKI